MNADESNEDSIPTIDIDCRFNSNNVNDRDHKSKVKLSDYSQMARAVATMEKRTH